MNDNEAISSSSPPRGQPWNKGKLIGANPSLRASHVWSIRTKLQLEGRTHDLALFNLAIDNKLRGCNVVAVRVDDVAPNGYTPDRATVRQKKAGPSPLEPYALALLQQGPWYRGLPLTGYKWMRRVCRTRSRAPPWKSLEHNQLCRDAWQHYCRSARAFAVNPSRLKARPLRARGLTAQAAKQKGWRAMNADMRSHERNAVENVLRAKKSLDRRGPHISCRTRGSDGSSGPHAERCRENVDTYYSTSNPIAT
jgi:hypothetical protein